MKELKFSFVILLYAFLFSCTNGKEPESSSFFDSIESKIDSIVVNIEYDYSEYDLCEPDPSLYPILDAVVNSANDCSELKNKGLLYCLWIHKEEDSLTRVKIELQEQKQMYCLQIGKLFIYKGLIFDVHADKQFKNLFRNSGLKVKYLCMKENILMRDFVDRMIACWEYIFEKNRIKCISYGFCDQHWMDERYYKMERVAQ